MQVNPSHQNDAVGQTEMIRRQAASRRPVSDGVSFDRSAALERALAATQEVRPEVVERARRLIEDTSYPPPEAINRIANLLGMKLAHDTQPGEES